LRADPATESNLILAFICLPLLILLVIGLLLRRNRSRNEVKFPTFSVRVRRVGREAAVVTLQEATGRSDFDADIGRRQVDVRMPSGLSEDSVADVVAKLSQALRSLSFEYLLYRIGESEIISEQERNAAISELRSMGFDVQVMPNGQVRLKGASGEPFAGPAKPNVPRWMHLMRAASGRIPKYTVLARSNSAADRI
jgi:hypothetical protein